MKTLQRRTKVICTLGPATFSRAAIRKLIQGGMNVARLNFAHGDYETFTKVIQYIRKLSKELGRHVSIMQDLAGPKLRTWKLKREPTRLKTGSLILISWRKELGDEKIISIPYAPLPKILKKGNSILLDDGLMELIVQKIDNKYIHARVKVGGVLKENKGVNIPYIKRKFVALTSKDKQDIKFGTNNKVDIVALSFIRSAHDITELKKLLPKSKCPVIVAKIEKPEALEHLDEIIEESDAIMVARGDLAVESSPEVVPCLQKEIIQKCKKAYKPVITATQMLESMVFNARPTRAEASDVANAVLDGTDALMLSGETASGKYPFKAVEMMNKIILEVERHRHGFSKHISHQPHMKDGFMPQKLRAMEKASCEIAEEVNVRLICCLTERGRSAAIISMGRPRQPIIAFTHEPSTVHRLSLVWGVEGFYAQELLTSRSLFNTISCKLLKMKRVKKKDRIIIATGVLTHSPDTTRIVKLHKI